ncbi:porin [Yoonia algicola]|uniref:Porin n=1 Tax=Yoonia algicola TaxID=3137368 RepID=A0AAN0M102_9RHOB
MKKVLLTTTALVFTAGFAAAEGHSAASITISGEAIAGVKYIEDAAQETTQFLELDFGVSGKTVTDGGLEVGASFDLDLNSGGEAAPDDEEVYISGGGITLTLGDVGSADDSVIANIADIGFDGIGIDDTAEFFFDTTTQNIHVKGEFGAITAVATANMDETGTDASEDYGIAVNYDAGTFSVGAGFTNNADEAGLDEDIETFILGGSVTAGGADINLFFHTADADDFAESVSGYGASVSYPMGALTLVASVGATDLDDDDADFGVGASYDLGGGVSFAGGIGQVDNPFADDDGIMVADMGIKMKF